MKITEVNVYDLSYPVKKPFCKLGIIQSQSECNCRRGQDRFGADRMG